MKFHHLAAAGALACIAVAAPPGWAQSRPADPANPAAQPNAATAEKFERRPAGGSAPAARRDAELLYEVLLGELSAGGDDPGTGFSLLLDSARKTDDERLYRRAAEVALQNRSGDAALQAARAWKAAHPGSRDANRYVLQILVALNRLDETAEPLARELAFSEPRSRALTFAAIPPLFARVTDKKRAAAIVQAALAEDLERPRQPADGASAWTTVGRMRAAAGDAEGVLDAARKAQALDPSAEGPAILALDLMDPKQPLAEPIVRKYLDSAKPLAEVRMGYARVLMDAQRSADAGRELRQLTEERPDFPEGWLLRGSQEAQEGQYAPAERSIQTYLDLARQAVAGASPSEAQARVLSQAYVVMAEIAEKRGDTQAAEGWLARVDSPQALLSAQARRASLMARQGRLSEARQLIQQVPARSPADERLKLTAEVQLLRDLNQQTEAYALLADAQRKAPDDTDLAYDLAMSAEKLGRTDEMERLLRKVILQRPEFPHAYNALGYALAERGERLPEARELIRKALQYAPEDPFITDSLGWVEFRMGRNDEATRILEGAYKAKPDAEIAAHLGEVLWVSGQRERAVAIWKEGLQLNPTNDTLLQTLKRLQVSL